MQALTDDELLRYDRQITLKGFDIDKQEQLKNASALIIGVGGLGCAASLYLASAGIGKLTLIDFDIVSKTNLHRQILYTKQSLEKNKVDQAKQALQQINPDIEITALNKKLDNDSLISMIEKQDIILDCTDNLLTRQQINACCYRVKKPLISGAAIRMEGLLTVFTYQDDTPCYHCLSHLFGQDNLTCVEAGVMAPLVGIIGSMQALEAIKIVTNYGRPLTHRLLMIDAITMQFTELTIPKWANCPVCQNKPLAMKADAK